LSAQPSIRSGHGRLPQLVVFALLAFLGSSGTASAEEPSFEVWPETDLWLRLSPSWRLSSFVALSKNIESNYREGSLIVQGDFAWGRPTLGHFTRILDDNRAETVKAFVLRGGLLQGKSLDDDGQAYLERTVLLEFHVRTPIRGPAVLSHRLRTDLRWLGERPEFSTRFRYRLMLEKEFVAGSVSLVPFMSVEPFYDTRFATVNRIRLIGGTTASWTSLLALEANMTYQSDSKSSVTQILALNIILHMFFSTGSTDN
jgi:hypothetical protein